MNVSRRYRRRVAGAQITGTCPVCELSFVLSADRAVLHHGPRGGPTCAGSGERVDPDRYPTALAAIRDAEVRRRIPEWQRLPLQASEMETHGEEEATRPEGAPGVRPVRGLGDGPDVHLGRGPVGPSGLPGMRGLGTDVIPT